MNSKQSMTSRSFFSLCVVAICSGPAWLWNRVQAFLRTPKITIAGLQFTNGGALLRLSGGAADQTYNVQAEANLYAGPWETVGSATAGIDGSFQFLDTSASNQPARFDRSSTP